MPKAKRFTEEEIQLLSKSPYIKYVKRNRLVFTYEFRCILYQKWEPIKRVSQITETLESYGFFKSIIGHEMPVNIHKNFLRHGKPSRARNKIYGINGQNINRYDDEFLIKSDVFIKSRRGVQFTSEFIDKVYKEYPDVSIESQLEAYGLDSEKVGYQRIYQLKKRLECECSDTKINIDIETVEKYSNHPFIQRCNVKQLALNDRFYNEASIFKGLSIDEILGIFEINGSDFSVEIRNRIKYKLKNWRPKELSSECADDIKFKSQIQYNKIKALEKISSIHFDKIKNNLSLYTFEQKKALCMWIKNLPHDRYDYSVRSILKKVGLPKSSYYSILSNEHYGMKEKQDEIDFQYIKKVMDYRGFKKGSRTIYMMLPNICGVHFGRTKILRLMKKFGCTCTIRKERTELKVSKEKLKANKKPNLLKRRFRLARPNEILLTDVSYLKYNKNQTEYLSCIKDAVTGRIVNHITSSSNDLKMVMDTMQKLRPTEKGLFHSDQGTLYFNDAFQKKLEELGYEQSMSRRGNCWDNSSQESYFGHMKDECDFSKCSTPEDLKQEVDNYVDYYNNDRPQWTRNKMAPVSYEKYLNSLSDGEYSKYIEKEQIKYDKMMEKAGQKALKRAVEYGAITQEMLDLWLKK